jgi:uncharacterized protein (TIGR00297 family)
MLSSYLPLALLLVIAMFLSVMFRKLTITAAIVGGLIGVLIFIGAGYTGIAMVAMFFLLGSTATSWRSGIKERLGIAELNKGRRKAGQVLANAGVAAILGLMIWQLPEHTGLFQLMMASSLASAASDTLSSELGNVYGRRFINIVSFKSDKRGENGVVSLEGTVFGVLGALVIAVVYSIGLGFTSNLLLIVIAGTIGNLADSVLGATFERRNYIGNDAVNFLNTAIAAAVGMLLCAMF